MPVQCQTSDSFCISRRFLRGAGASVRHPGHVRLPSIGRSAPCRLSGGGFSDCVLRREFLLLHGTRLPAYCPSPGKFGDVIRPRFSEKFKIRASASKQKSGAYCCGFGQSRGVVCRSCGFEPRAGRRKHQPPRRVAGHAHQGMAAFPQSGRELPQKKRPAGVGTDARNVIQLRSATRAFCPCAPFPCG